jgi:hypothetical protein
MRIFADSKRKNRTFLSSSGGEKDGRRDAGLAPRYQKVVHLKTILKKCMTHFFAFLCGLLIVRILGQFRQ